MAKDKDVFLVEDEEINACISFEKARKIRLSVNKALALLPSEVYYESDTEKPAYFVNDGKVWYQCRNEL